MISFRASLLLVFFWGVFVIPSTNGQETESPSITLSITPEDGRRSTIEIEVTNPDKNVIVRFDIRGNVNLGYFDLDNIHYSVKFLSNRSEDFSKPDIFVIVEESRVNVVEQNDSPTSLYEGVELVFPNICDYSIGNSVALAIEVVADAITVSGDLIFRKAETLTQPFYTGYCGD